jgi:energy-coupling factor transporter ATP-binding protein EcfA2
MKITALRANSLRGIPADWPEVEFGEKGLVVYGPNGVGKSSLIDALEFVLTGKPTLYSANRAGVNWQTGGPHVGGGGMAASIVLRADGQDHQVVAASAPPAAASGWCTQAQTAGFVLRRHMLLAFIEAPPKPRYERLEPFLNLQEYLKVESALAAKAKAAGDDATAKEAAHRREEQRVRGTFGLAPDVAVTEAALLAALNEVLARAGLARANDVQTLGVTAEAVATQLGTKAVGERLVKLHALKGKAQKLGLASNLKPLMEGVQNALSDLEREVDGRGAVLMTELLTTGRDIIVATQPDDCPLCEQAVDRNVLMARLSERIAADERVTAAKVAVAARLEALSEPTKELSREMRSFMKDWEATLRVPLPPIYGQTEALLDAICENTKGAMNRDAATDFVVRLSAAVASHGEVITAIDDAIVREGGGERRKELSDAKLMIDGFKVEWVRCLKAKDEMGAARGTSAILARLHGHATSARKETVQALLDEVAGIANRFYEVIHPDEQIAKSKLFVKANEDGSVNIETEFYGRSAPPMLYYSESHLDTLGLCYFLALRRREADKNPSFKVLVLDDVVHSVDAKHRARFAKLLKDEFSDHQILISTHDVIFYQRLRDAFGSNGFKYLALTGWDIARGPIRGDASTDIDRIVNEEIRLSKSPEELSAAGGRFFEYVLQKATEALDVSIPARFDKRHTIGSMWPPLAKKLRKNPYFKQMYPTLADDIERSGWVRNEVGAHYNEADAPVDPEEVRAHAKHLADLYSAIYCDDCTGFIRKVTDQDFRCGCEVKVYRVPPVAPSVEAAE